jgi:hypothetical protein
MIHMMHMIIASFESKAMMAMMAMDGYGWRSIWFWSRHLQGGLDGLIWACYQPVTSRKARRERFDRWSLNGNNGNNNGNETNSSNMFEHFHIPNSFQHVPTCSNYFMIFIRCLSQGPRNPMSAENQNHQRPHGSTWRQNLRSDVALRCGKAESYGKLRSFRALKLYRLCRCALPFGQGSGSQNNMAPSHVEIAIGCHWMLPSAKEQAAPEDCALIQTDSDRFSLDFLPVFYPFDLSQLICSVTCSLPRHAPCNTFPHLYTWCPSQRAIMMWES